MNGGDEPGHVGIHRRHHLRSHIDEGGSKSAPQKGLRHFESDIPSTHHHRVSGFTPIQPIPHIDARLQAAEAENTRRVDTIDGRADGGRRRWR